MITFQNKNPQTKQEAIALLARSVKGKIVSKKELAKDLHVLSDSLVKLLDDGTDQVRESAADALASFIHLLGENATSPFMRKLDKVKAAKVQEKLTQCGRDSPSKPKASGSSSTLQSSNKENAPPPATVSLRPKSTAIGTNRPASSTVKPVKVSAFIEPFSWYQV